MKNRIIIISVLVFSLLFSGVQSFAQERVEEIVGEDKVFSTPFCSAAIGWTFPFGEMGNRYEPFMNVDANLGWKTGQNFLYTLEFNFGFGVDNAKQKLEILSEIMTTDKQPFVISDGGSDAGVVAFNRNLAFTGKVGKLIPLMKSKPNSGLMLMAGGGWLQHQIIYQATLEKAPQLEGDYALGYDRQMRGLSLNGFVGYMHMSKTHFLNFYIGLDFSYAWTKMTREYQFDLKGGDDKLYQDAMLTLKFGWMFPFFGRDTDKIYYY